MKLASRIARKLRSYARAIQQEMKFRENAAAVRRLSAASSATSRLIVDCGFNKGVVASRLLQKLPEFSLVGFEVQQDIQGCADNVKKRFPGRKIDVIYAAVGDKDGAVAYYEPSKWGKNYKGGTTTVADKRSMSVNYEQPKTAPSIDFSRWLAENVSDAHFVFVKMDIEGGEYGVIEHLLATGAIDRIDVLAVEWHADKFPEPTRTKYLDIEKRIRRYADDNRITVMDWY